MGKRLASLFPSIKTDDIEDLEERSAKLMSINNDLVEYIKWRDRNRGKRPLEIAYYFEEQATIAKKNIGVIVTKPSPASLPGIAVFPIPSNHYNMCKFAGDFVNGYISVSGQLTRWISMLDIKDKTMGYNEVCFVVRMLVGKLIICNRE